MTGLVASIVLDPLYAAVFLSVPHMGSDPVDMVYPSFAETALRFLPFLMLEGALGGATFWFVTVRTPPRTS